MEHLMSWKGLSCIITLLGGLQFIIITFIAMFYYPDGYSFTGDYFSYLGNTINLKTGSINNISRILFLIACVVVGASLIPFWIVIATFFIKTKLMKYVSLSGSIMGVISSICLMGVGIFAENSYYLIHTSLAKMFFSSIIIAILVYSFAILLNSEYHYFYSFIGIGFSIGTIFLLYTFRNSMIMNVILQKVIVYGYCVWVTLHILEILRKIGISFNYKHLMGGFKKKFFVPIS